MTVVRTPEGYLDIQDMVFDPNAIHVNVPDEIHQIVEKPVPVAADVMVIEDSAAAWIKKRIQVGSLPQASAVLIFGNNNFAATITTRFLSPGNKSGTADTAIRSMVAPRAGTLRNLRIIHNVPAGNGNLVVYTVQINAIDTAITASIASTASTASDLVNTATVAAGDLISVKITKALAIGTSPTDPNCTLEFGA